MQGLVKNEILIQPDYGLNLISFGCGSIKADNLDADMVYPESGGEYSPRHWSLAKNNTDEWADTRKTLLSPFETVVPSPKTFHRLFSSSPVTLLRHHQCLCDKNTILFSFFFPPSKLEVSLEWHAMIFDPVFDN